MEVILKQDVEKLGKAGAIVKAKDGFAHNFLIPKGLAVPSSPVNLRRLEQAKQSKILQQARIRKALEKTKDALLGLSLTMPVLAQDDERLYGSVSVADIAAALKAEGFTVDEEAVILQEPIKSLGIYEVEIRLHPEISAKIKVWVVKK